MKVNSLNELGQLLQQQHMTVLSHVHLTLLTHHSSEVQRIATWDTIQGLMVTTATTATMVNDDDLEEEDGEDDDDDWNIY